MFNALPYRGTDAQVARMSEPLMTQHICRTDVAILWFCKRVINANVLTVFLVSDRFIAWQFESCV